MGVTIHYTLITRHDVVAEVLRFAEESAKASGWRTERFSAKAYVGLMKTFLSKDFPIDVIKDNLRKRWGGYREQPPEDRPPTELPLAYFWTTEEFVAYAEPAIVTDTRALESNFEGIVVSSDVSESFNLGFYKLGNLYICDNSVKTQPYTLDDAETCVRFHVFICQLLRELERRWADRFEVFYIVDEGEYYDGGVERLRQLFEKSSEVIYSIASKIATELVSEEVKVIVGGQHEVKPLEERPSDYIQTTLDMFTDVPQTFYCHKCGVYHQVERCPRDG